VLTRAADRLETALRGGAVDPGAVDDVAFAQELQGLNHLLVPLGPPVAFVNALHDRLLSEPLVAAPRAPVPVSGVRVRPRVLTLGGGRRRGVRVALTGALGVLVLAMVVGVAGRSSLPGQPLYAARQLVDHVGVALGGSEQGRGVRLLDVAERHIDDALLLASEPARSTVDLRTSLTDGLEATQGARQTLVSDFGSRADPQSLTVIGAFAGRVLPPIATLAQTAPDVADTVRGLRAQVVSMRDEALHLLAACTSCGAATDEARQQLATLSPTQAPTTAAGSASSTSSAAPTGPAASASPPTGTSGGGAPLPAPSTASGGGPGSVGSPQPSTAARTPSTSVRPGATTGGGAGGGSATAGPTNPVAPTQGSTPSPSAVTSLPPAPTSLLPTLPTLPTVTLSPTLPTPSVSATITLGGVTTTATLP